MAEQDEIASRVTGDGMPIGNITVLPIQPGQVKTTSDGSVAPTFDDTAAATIVWNDYQQAARFVDENSWLMEWQYIEYLYQSPNYDRDFRTGGQRPARISRFNVAKNRNTLSTQVRRAVFTDSKWFVLEPRGKLAGNPDAELYMNAWTELFNILCDRADVDYQIGRLFIECQVLQGTAIAVPGWEEKSVKRTHREPMDPPKKIDKPDGSVDIVHTWKSDNWKSVDETRKESWPFIEYRRLGTTLFNEKWRHPGRPDISGFPRIDIDMVNFQDLQQLRALDCYKDIPNDDELIKFFLSRPDGDADPGTEMMRNSGNNMVIMKATGENAQVSKNPFQKPLMKLAYWTEDHVLELLCYEGRRKIIRNGRHNLGEHAAGYTANWYNIDDSGYGFGQGRLNAGDQRMAQGVLNEVLKMIAFPLNAPVLYDNATGNAPTQNVIAGLGTFLGLDTGKSGDIRKAIGFMEMPNPPEWAWRIFQLAMQGGEDLVGANQTTMQGQLGGPSSSFGRTAAGANRLSSKADEGISDPVEAIEQVLVRFLQFLWKMVQEVMPIKEIRDILSNKFGAAILEQLNAALFLDDAIFDIKILAGQKLAAKAAISQLIPFLLQIMQQPQLLEFLHQKGKTVNFEAIEDLFLRMSELAGREDIFIDLTPEQKQMVQAMQPGQMKIQADTAKETLRGKNEIAKVQEQGKQDLNKTLVDKALDHIAGSVPLELAEARLERNTDMNELQQGVGA